MTIKERANLLKAIELVLADVPDMILAEYERLTEGQTLPSETYTKEECYNIAMNYHTVCDFARNAPEAHLTAIENKWIDDYNWLMKPPMWDFEACKTEAAKYKSKKEFSRGATGAYLASVRNGWINLFEWTEGRRHWTYEKCKECASQCRSKTEFSRKFHSGYVASIEKGWIDDFIFSETGHPHKKKYKHWNEDNCREEAKKYTTVQDFARCSPGACNKAKKYGWITQYDWLKTTLYKKRTSWTKEKCAEEAAKYDTRTQFARNSQSAYAVARRNGWLNDYEWKGGNTKWTETLCRKEAEKYDNILDYMKKSPSAYNAAKKYRWIDNYTWLKRKNIRWNLDRCIKEAEKYTCVADFQKYSKYAYTAAVKNQWLDKMRYSTKGKALF